MGSISFCLLLIVAGAWVCWRQTFVRVDWAATDVATLKANLVEMWIARVIVAGAVFFFIHDHGHPRKTAINSFLLLVSVFSSIHLNVRYIADGRGVCRVMWFRKTSVTWSRIQLASWDADKLKLILVSAGHRWLLDIRMDGFPHILPFLLKYLPEDCYASSDTKASLQALVMLGRPVTEREKDSILLRRSQVAEKIQAAVAERGKHPAFWDRGGSMQEIR
jgi:hypothetical protein